MSSKEALEKELLELLKIKEDQLKYNKFFSYFKETGDYRRELYQKHWDYMQAGEHYMERALFGGNGTGKTHTGSYEGTCHLTGIYPEGWTGRKFNRAITMWCVGYSNEQTKRVMQKSLLGDLIDIGTGMVPRNLIVDKPKMKAGVPDAVSAVYVRHSSGGISKCYFLAAEQGREPFQGDNIDFIWVDEELKDPKIYSECIARLRNPIRPGLISSTFTPLLGLSQIALSFLPGGIFPKDGKHPTNRFKFAVQLSVYDAPHLTADYIENIKATYSPHEMRARLYGEPSLGSGAIYPTYLEDEIVIDNFVIPEYWPRCYGMDVGNKTAAVWLAMNPDTREIYVWSEYYRNRDTAANHASAIKLRGTWITGAIDVAVRGMRDSDGEALLKIYEDEGLHLVHEKISPEAGILKISQMFISGQLRVFRTCTDLLSEFRIYRRDEDGKIVKENDHLLDALRYAIMLGIDYMDVEPDPDYKPYREAYDTDRDPITGY